MRRLRRRQWHLRVFLQLQVLALVPLRVLVVVQKSHGEMRAGRIRELEEFHRFLEVLSSWLALTDDAFVPELRQCLFVPNEIQ